MYQSIPSLTIPREKSGEFFERVNSPRSQGTKKVRNPDPRGRKIVLKPHPGARIFKNTAKNTKHETEIIKNIAEMLICLIRNIKTVKHIEAQSPLVVDESYDQIKEAEKWSFKSKIWKPKISSFVIKKP